MAGIAVVSNPRSWRNRRSPGAAARLRALLGAEGEVVEPSTPEELAAAVARFRERRVDVVAVNGGDGTGHLVMTALAAAYRGEPLPDVALLRGGAMNTVADANEVRGSPERLLRALLERRRAGAVRTLERDLLELEIDGAPPRHGFLFGTGTVVVFLDAYYRTGWPTAATAAALLVRAVGSALVGGRFAGELTAREALRVTADGEDWPDLPYLGVLAGAVPEMGFGFKPFSRCDEQPGFFHAVGVTGSTFQVAAGLPRIWFGRPWKRSLAVDGVTRDLAVEGEEPFRITVDGDLYRVERRVRIRTGPAVRLVI